MKKLFLILLACSVLFVSNCFAVSGADALKSSGLLGPNAHVHLTTSPMIIHSIIVTPESTTNGFAQLIETTPEIATRVADAASGLGGDFISGRETSVRADIQGATTAGTSIVFDCSEGIYVEDNLFVDCQDATVQIFYKE